MKIKNKIFIIFYLILIVNLAIKNLYAEIPLYIINAIEISYKDNNNIIIAKGKAHAKDQFGKEILSDEIVYDKKNQIIKTKKNSIYKDLKGNILFADEFLYELQLKKISASTKVKYVDMKNNQFYFDSFTYYEESEKGYGNNMKGIMSDKSSIESPFFEIDNLKGVTVAKNSINDENFFDQFLKLFRNKEINYTTCVISSDTEKKITDSCPDWSFSTSKTTHDEKYKIIKHNNAIIKIKNIPVFYTPYFSHPDPTVQRKSGFLSPSIKNFNNLGRTIKTPYFLNIDDNSDLTFTPIYYFKENSIFLTEYRKQNKNNTIYLDSSYSKGYKNLNKLDESGNSLNRTAGSRNHIYFGFLGKYDDLFFETNDVEINLQRISQKNYLRVNEINTNFVKQDDSNLKNNFSFSSYENSKRLKFQTSIYESLQDDNPNSKYSYNIPYVSYDDYFEKFNNHLNFSTTFEANNYGGDNNKITQTNILSSDSSPLIFKSIGVSNIVKTNILNTNIYNSNIENEKENLNNNIYATIALETNYPLIKTNEKTEEIITPKIFAKYTPGEMRNQSSTSKILSYSDIYSIDRLGSNVNRETGSSLGYGIEYDINKKNDNKEIFLKSKFNIGQVMQIEKNNKMPNNSSLNDTKSNFVGNFNFFFNQALTNERNKEIEKGKFIKEGNIKQNFKVEEGFQSNYEFNISNDLKKLLRSNLSISYLENKNFFTTKYYETHDIDNSQQIEFQYLKGFNNNINIKMSALKNLETKSSESNSVEINYESDCFKIGMSLAKKFYEGDDLKKENNLTLFILLKPFGQPVAPDITNLIKSN